MTQPDTAPQLAPPRRVVVAIDKFKGSLTAEQAATAVREGVLRADPTAEVWVVPVADGGDGTLAAAIAAGFTAVPVSCRGPLGDAVQTAFARRGTTRVVELADACGLLRLEVAPDRASGLSAGTSGLGEVMAAALADAATDPDGEPSVLVVGVGGSASTDGGAGLLVALGARLLDAQGQPIGPGALGLQQLVTVDLTGLHPQLAHTELVLATDVDHVLLGPRGAAAVFGPQKGLDASGVEMAESGLRRLADLVEAQTGVHREQPGAGAAGGTGWALQVLGAQVRPGIEVVLEWSAAAARFAGADLVITGEGSVDEQSLGGKTPVGVARLAHQYGVPVGLVAGRISVTAQQLASVGIGRAVALTELVTDPRECFDRASHWVAKASEQLLTHHAQEQPGSG